MSGWLNPRGRGDYADARMLSRYRLLKPIAKGGMAEVFEAVAVGEDGFERKVAIKRILPQSIDDELSRRMFLDEARIASSLHHANIVAVLDYGVADGTPFQVLEYVSGIDAHRCLSSLRRGGSRFPVELALFICGQIAHGLHHAHHATDSAGRTLGIVHRDVKLSNILLSWDGDVKLTDFGIAFARNRAERTHAGTVKGTPLFMAPEQVMSGAVDARTDVFALGCVLHALIAGNSPLAGSDALMKLVAGVPLPLDPELPEDARAVVEQATRRSAADRFASAEEMADALGRALLRRVEAEPRSLLKKFLSELRPPERAPPARLDALVNLELVAVPTETGERHFVTEATRGHSTRRDPPMRVRSLGVLGAVVLLIGAAGGTVAWRLSLRAQAPAGHAAAVPAEPPAAAPPAATSALDPPAVPTADAVDAERVTHRRKGGKSAPERAAPPASTAVGFLAVGGEAVFNAEVLVDGRPRGFAPRLLELPVGKHRIELIGKQGRRLAARELTLTTRHTQRAPLKFPDR